MENSVIGNGQFWYKQAVIYQINVKSYCDSNGDGTGDFNGLMSKLPYIESLGVSAIWLQPFYPSPLKDDGYDIADYYDIHPSYGTLKDFKAFLKEAHKRNIKVITELVINHTSDQHPWFQKSRMAKKGKWRDLYMWSETPDKYKDARIIFKDFESSNWTWDHLAQAYYWHRFYFHQPDLNFDSPHLQDEIFKIVDFWLKMGVDGMRLDAIPYLYAREGTNCENLPETHAFLKKLRNHIDCHYENRILLAEANQWPEDAVTYFGEGDECHMAFHFPVMPRLFMAIRMEDRFPIVDILEQTPLPPKGAQWAMFLRNHDELTLEMVTDEERDYMYRVYADDERARINLGIRRRLAPLLENNRAKIELMNILLLSLPGTPIIYYGDEIGMGDNYYLGDRNGVRTPMQWDNDRNAGFSKGNPQKLFLPLIIDPLYHYQAVNVENQEANLSSLLWWMRRVILLRQRYHAFGFGEFQNIPSDNPRVLTFTRRHQGQTILIVVNLSRFSQYVNLSLQEFEGYRAKEVFSQTPFLSIRSEGLPLTLGPYGYFWFSLEKCEEEALLRGTIIPQIALEKDWKEIFKQPFKDKLLREILPNYLSERRWFGEKSASIQKLTFEQETPYHHSVLTIIEAEFAEGTSSKYFLPLTILQKTQPQPIDHSGRAIASLTINGEQFLLVDAVYSEEFRAGIINDFLGGKKHKSPQIIFEGTTTSYLKKERITPQTPLPSHLTSAEQSNTSILYDEKFFLKLYRKMQDGTNPEIEMTKFLTETRRFPNIPQYLGSLSHKINEKKGYSLGILQKYISSEGDCWTYFKSQLTDYYERFLSRGGQLGQWGFMEGKLMPLLIEDIPQQLQNLISIPALELALNLGITTAKLHLSLGKPTDSHEFCPEPFSLLYQRSILQTMRMYLKKVFNTLKQKIGTHPKDIQAMIKAVLDQERAILEVYNRLIIKKLNASKIRIHGDLHLGQILYTGRDYLFLDFEGEPAKNITERKLKRSVVQDLVGMLRSFHYASLYGLFNHPTIREKQRERLFDWSTAWYRATAGVFLKGYLNTIFQSPINLIPDSPEDFRILFDAFILEKVIYEIGYEANNRPDWIKIPLMGFQNLIGSFENQNH